MSNLSKEQKKLIKTKLNSLFDFVHLQCDGYAVSATLHRISDTKLGIVVYVDGFFRGKWSLGENQDEEAKRFYPTHKKQLFTPKEVKLLDLNPDKAFYYFRRHYFSTANVFVNHICKHNDDIKILTDDEYNKLIAEKELENAH